MKPDKLTLKQEMFVQRLISGDTQRVAYKKAYNAEKMKDVDIDCNACKLANSTKVVQRLKELQEATAKAIIWDKARSLKELKEIVEMAKDNALRKTDDGEIIDTGLLNAATRAIAELNKVLGLNAPEKSEVDSTIKVIMGKGVEDYGE